jgi:alpha-D-xyloside xylohydrolase
MPGRANLHLILLEKVNDHSIQFTIYGETVRITSWGPSAFRVQAWMSPYVEQPWALTENVTHPSCEIDIQKQSASMINGKLRVDITMGGKLTFSKTDGTILLEEAVRIREAYNLRDPKCSSLNIKGREFRPIMGTESFKLTARFESTDPEERIYGMGQYQQSFLNLKGADLEMAQRNSQASIPFALSSLGYGFLWNNPAVGRAVFAKNGTSFEAYSTKALDYWIVAGDTPKDITRAYANAH